MLLLIPLIVVYIKIGMIFMPAQWILYYFLWACFEELMKNNKYILYRKPDVMKTHIFFWVIEWLLKIKRGYWIIWVVSSLILHTLFGYITEKWLKEWDKSVIVFVILIHFSYNYLVYLIQQ